MAPISMTLSYLQCFYSFLSPNNNNNNNNSHDNVYGAVIMTKVIARVHPDVLGDLKSVLEDSSKHGWKICIIGQHTMIF